MVDFIIIISGIGCIQSMLFGLLVFQKKNKHLSDWILLTWFIVFAIHLGCIILVHTQHALVTVIFAKTLGLLHGPFLFFYTLAVFKNVQLKSALLHALPFILFGSTAFLVNDKSIDVWEISLVTVKTISLLAYPIFVGDLLKRKLKSIKHRRADHFIVDLNWIKTSVGILILYASIGFFHILLDVLFQIEFSIAIDIVVFVIMITIIGFYGLKFKVVYEPEIAESVSSTPEYKNSPLKKEKLLTLKKDIDSFFNTSEAYLNSNFSLTQLSEKLNIPKHHLSEILNLEMETTFYDIVNAKRIQCAVQKMHNNSDANITLEALGYDVGYNSKSSFYHHFKKYTGKTPRQYKIEISSN